MSPQTGFLVSSINLINSWESQINRLAKSSRRFFRHHNLSLILNLKHIIQKPLVPWHELAHLSGDRQHGFVSCYSYSFTPLLLFMAKMTLGSLEQSPMEISLGNSDGKVPIFLKSMVKWLRKSLFHLTLMSVLTTFIMVTINLHSSEYSLPGEVQALRHWP